MRQKPRWYGGLHWAYSETAYFGAFASLPTGQFILRHELTFLKVIPELAAREINALREKHDMEDFGGVWAQPQIFPPDGEFGEFISETFIRHGVPVHRGVSDHVALFSRLRSWFHPWRQANGREEPSLLIHPSCTRFIHTIPAVEPDDDDAERVAITEEVYPSLAAGYFVMSRPRLPEAVTAPYPPGSVYPIIEELRAAAQKD